MTVTFTFLTFTFTFYKTSHYKGSNGLDWIDWQVLLLAPPSYHSLSLSTQMSQYKTYPAELCGCLSGLWPLFKFLSFTLNKMSRYKSRPYWKMWLAWRLMADCHFYRVEDAHCTHRSRHLCRHQVVED